MFLGAAPARAAASSSAIGGPERKYLGSLPCMAKDGEDKSLDGLGLEGGWASDI